MTGTIIVDRVREMLHDKDDSNYDWTEGLLAKWINDTVQEVIGLRSDALIDTDGSIITVTELSETEDGLSGTISIADKWQYALVQGVLVKCYQREGGNRANTLKADKAREEFLRLIGAV